MAEFLGPPADVYKTVTVCTYMALMTPMFLVLYFFALWKIWQYCKLQQKKKKESYELDPDFEEDEGADGKATSSKKKKGGKQKDKKLTAEVSSKKDD